MSLTHYNPKKDITVASDTCNLGLGAVISHKESNGQVKVSAHASRTLLPAKKGYSQIDKKALEIFFAVKSSTDSFIEVFCFKQTTDCYCQFLVSKKGIPTHIANQLQRRRTILLNYNFKTEFLPSNRLGHVDGLYRLILKLWEPLKEIVIEIEIKSMLCNTIQELPMTINEIKNKAKINKYITKK